MTGQDIWGRVSERGEVFFLLSIIKVYVLTIKMREVQEILNKIKSLHLKVFHRFIHRDTDNLYTHLCVCVRERDTAPWALIQNSWG